MSQSARYVESAVLGHLEAARTAQRAWSEAHEQIASEYEARVTQAAAWRLLAMADADDKYRAAHGQATAQLVMALPAEITQAIETGEV
jgi:hypothetical protein